MISVSVIPNEKKSDIPDFHKEASSDEKHYSLLTDFCSKVGIETTKEKVYDDLLNKGCIIILTMFGNTIVTCLPEVLTESQLDKLKELKPFYMNFEYHEFSSWFNNDIHIFPNEDIPQNTVDYFYDELDRIYKEDLAR